MLMGYGMHIDKSVPLCGICLNQTYSLRQEKEINVGIICFNLSISGSFFGP